MEDFCQDQHYLCHMDAFQKGLGTDLLCFYNIVIVVISCLNVFFKKILTNETILLNLLWHVVCNVANKDLLCNLDKEILDVQFGCCSQTKIITKYDLDVRPLFTCSLYKVPVVGSSCKYPGRYLAIVTCSTGYKTRYDISLKYLSFVVIFHNFS